MPSIRTNQFKASFAAILILGFAFSAPSAAHDPSGKATIGLGVDNDSHLRGEISHVFSESDRSAWIGEAWFGRSVGGIKLNRHWIPKGDDHSANPHVRKIFGAWDRNTFGDQKLTLGGGLETEAGFWGAYGALGITGRRELGTISASTIDVISGADPILGPFREEITTTIVTRIFEQAYDFGIGLRAGRFFPSSMTQMTLGIDHEWGKASSNQTTISMLVEKYFDNSPHSFAINLASIDRRGDFENIRHDHRAGIFWRYAFDSSGKKAYTEPPAHESSSFTTNHVARNNTIVADAKTEQGNPSGAKNTQEFEIVFELEKEDLQPGARVVLDEVARRGKLENTPYPLTIIGHTCDLGNEHTNQALSEKRAKVVMNYLVDAGISAKHITAIGKSETDPRYPNTRVDRHKNQHCEIVLTVTPQAHESPAEKQEAIRTTITPNVPHESKAEKKWLSRALLNTVRHKQEVDVYRTQESTTTSSIGNRAYLNAPPQAVNDVSVWFGSRMPAIIDVLANDTDPDNDLLTITSVTNGAHGDVTVRSDGKLQYVVHKGWEGIDRFSYTISDGKGGISTAIVTIMIIDP